MTKPDHFPNLYSKNPETSEFYVQEDAKGNYAVMLVFRTDSAHAVSRIMAHPTTVHAPNRAMAYVAAAAIVHCVPLPWDQKSPEARSISVSQAGQSTPSPYHGSILRPSYRGGMKTRARLPTSVRDRPLSRHAPPVFS